MSRILRAATIAAALLAPTLAAAQTSPNWSYGFVPTPAQWNAEWASKQDYLGAPPLLTTGGTMLGKLVTAAPNTSRAGINLPAGVAPTSPLDGDLWTTTAGVFARINGATVGPFISPSTALVVGSSPVTGGSASSSYQSFLTNNNGTLGNGHVVDIGCGVACGVGLTSNFNVYPAGNLFNGVQLGTGTGAGNGEGGSITFWTRNPSGAPPNNNQELGFVQAYAEIGGVIPGVAPPALVFITTQLWAAGKQGTGVLFQATTRDEATAKGEACIAEGLTVAFMSGACSTGLGIGTINGAAGVYDNAKRVLSASNPTLTINQNAQTQLTVQNTTNNTGALAEFLTASNAASLEIGSAATLHSATLFAGRSFVYANSILVVGSSGANGTVIAVNGAEAARFNGLTPGQLTLGLAGSTVGKLQFTNATSGGITFTPVTGALGTTAIAVPATAGTLGVAATAPVTLNATTGTIACATCVTSSGGGAISGTLPISVSAAGVVSIATPIDAQYGGTGRATLTANAFLTGNGTGTVNMVAVTGLVLGNGASAPSAYAGASCTNQAATAISAVGALTCSSITNAFLTAGTFSSITGTGTLTAGATGAGFTIALTTSTVTGTLPGANFGPLTGDVTTSSYAATIANNAVTLAKLATQATNTVLGNATSGTAVPTALAVATCSTSSSALIWTTNTGFGCNAAINAATLGGATFSAPGAIGGGTPSTGAFTTTAVSTSETTPLVIGGAATSSTLTLESTSGSGATDAVIFKTGSQVERARILTGGNFNIGASTTPTANSNLLTVNMNSAAALVTTAAVPGIQVVSANGANAGVTIDVYGIGLAGVYYRHAGGTLASPTATPASTQYAAFGGKTYDGSAYNNSTFIAFQTINQTSVSDRSSFMQFYTVASSSTSLTENMRLQGSGGLSIGAVTTDPGSGGLIANGATIRFTALASVATTSALCYNTSTGLLTYNATVGTCTVSTIKAKDLVARLTPQEGFDIVMAMEPWRYTLKEGRPTYLPGEQIGMIAEYAAKADARLVAFNPDGSAAGFRAEQYTAALTAALQKVGADNDNLRSQVEDLARRASRN